MHDLENEQLFKKTMESAQRTHTAANPEINSCIWETFWPNYVGYVIFTPVRSYVRYPAIERYNKKLEAW